MVRVTMQGISPDRRSANGSYDPLELGMMELYDLGELLHSLRNIRPLPVNTSGADLCPPSVVIEANGEIENFEISGGELVYSATGKALSIDEALSILDPGRSMPKSSGDFKKSKSQLEWGSDHKDVKGLTPVRKFDIPPTNRIKTEGGTIDIYSSPQFRDMVYKSASSKDSHKGPLMFMILTIVLGLGAFAVSEVALRFVCLLITIGFILLSVLLKSKAKTGFAFGFDWSHNAVWAKFDTDRIPSYLGNANCIIKFSVSEMNMSNKKTIWYLIAEKTDGSRIQLKTFYDSSEAFRICMNANDLLSRQV